jgi:hypothetical protein
MLNQFQRAIHDGRSAPTMSHVGGTRAHLHRADFGAKAVIAYNVGKLNEVVEARRWIASSRRCRM